MKSALILIADSTVDGAERERERDSLPGFQGRRRRLGPSLSLAGAKLTARETKCGRIQQEGRGGFPYLEWLRILQGEHLCRCSFSHGHLHLCKLIPSSVQLCKVL